MKVHQPDTDRELQLTVLANGRPCAEYAVKNTSDLDLNTLECFIPVSDGDLITLRGTFTGSCLNASIDLLADGAFVGDKRFESGKDGVIKFHDKKKIEFKNVFDAPKDSGHTSLFPPEKIVEGNLRIKALDNDFDRTTVGADGDTDDGDSGLGGLTLVICMNQESTDEHGNHYKTLTCGDWKNEQQATKSGGGLAPEHELIVEVPTESTVTKTRANKHKRHREQSRFGSKSWATLVFYYRSREAIEQADCELRSSDSHALDPIDPDTEFIKGSTEAKKPGPKKGKKQDDQASIADEASRRNRTYTDGQRGLFATPAPEIKATPTPAPTEVSKATPAPAATPKPAPPSILTPPPTHTTPKKKLMGQQLNLPSDCASSPTTNNAGERRTGLGGDNFSKAAEEYREEVRRQETKRQRQQQAAHKIKPFSEFNSELDKLPTLSTLACNRSSSTLMHPMGDEGVDDAISDAENFLRESLQHLQQAAPAARMVASRDSTNGGDDVEMQDQAQHVKVEDEEVTSPLRTESLRTGALHDTDEIVRDSEKVSTTSPDHLERQGGGFGDIASTGGVETMTSPQKSRQSTGSQSACNVTLGQIRDHIPAEGIKLPNLMKCFDAEQLPAGDANAARDFCILVNKVAFADATKTYFLRPTQLSQSQSQKANSRGSSQVIAPSPQAEEKTKEDREEMKVIQHYQTKELPAERTTKDFADEAAAMSNLKNKPAQTESKPSQQPSLKRKDSAMPSSRESTPTVKKARLNPDALAAATKRAEMQERLNAAKARNTASKKAAEEQRKRREAQQEAQAKAEARELAILEELMRNEEAEPEEYDRIAAEEEEAFEEAKTAKERAEKAIRESEGL